MSALWDLVVNNFLGFLFVTARISGIFTFNPIFSRSNVTTRIKVGASFAFSAVTLMYLGGNVYYNVNGVVDLVFTLIQELAIGLVLGFLMNLIMTVIIYAGDVIDTQVGFGMAKAMDPSTGIQMPLLANVYYYMFILYFFIVGGHLKYIELFIMSYDTLPIGFSFTADTLNLVYFIANFMGTVMVLAVKFAMPVIAAELITECILGVMMKAVPSIQIFILNIQLKIIVGLSVLLAIAKPMSDFLEYLMEIMFANLNNALGLIGV